MKAWEELSNDRNVTLVYTGLKDNPNSWFYIDHGVKIERFADGHYEINNVMLAGDHYDPVANDEYQMFEREGWLPGCYQVCINTFRKRLDKVDYLIGLEVERQRVDEDRLDMLAARKGELSTKLNRYLELMENLSKFATK